MPEAHQPDGDGAELPAIGFGTYPLKGEDGVDAVVSALQAGYRLLDTAVNYGNEAEVGEALRRSGVPREEVLVTSKLPGRDHGYDQALASIRGSLDRLGCEYLDLHLIHWPNPSQGRYLEAWRALVTARDEGLVRGWRRHPRHASGQQGCGHLGAPPVLPPGSR